MCDVQLRPVSSSCHLSSGISSTKGGTSSIESYYIFQAALEYMDTTIRSSDTNFNRLCHSVFTRMEMGGICQQKFELFNIQSKKISDVVIDCKREPELYVGLRLCSTPCMRDAANKCCYVPTAIALLFPCCRQLSCCPDQMVGSRRSLGTKAMQPRGLPAVSVSVSIEETSSSKSTYDSTMLCLKSPTAVCLQTHKLSIAIKVTGAGRRNLQQNNQGSSGPQACLPTYLPACLHPGQCSH